jgi:hypothetical protein
MTRHTADHKSELTPRQYIDARGGCMFIRGDGTKGNPIKYWAGKERYTENPDDALWFRSRYALHAALQQDNQ